MASPTFLAPVVQRLRNVAAAPSRVFAEGLAVDERLANKDRLTVGAVLLAAEVRRSELPQRAAATAYAFMFALIPLFTTSLAFFTAFPGLGAERARIERVLFENLLPGAAANVEGYIAQFAQRAAAAGTVSSLVFFIVVLTLFKSVEGTFNRVWKAERARTWGQRLTLLAVFLVIGGVAGTLMVVVTAEAARITERYDLASSALGVRLQSLAYSLLSIFASWVLFVVPTKWLPNARVRWVPALAGGVVAGTAWHLLKDAFTWFITDFASYENVYGAVAVLPVFLLWVYLTVLLLLGGSAIAFVVQNFRTLIAERRVTTSRGPQRAWHAVALLSILARAFHKQEQPVSAVELARRLSVGQYVIAESVRPLVEAGVVLAIPHGTEQRYAIGVPPETLSVGRVVALTTGEDYGVPEHGPDALRARVAEVFERAKQSEGNALEAVTIGELAQVAPEAHAAQS